MRYQRLENGLNWSAAAAGSIVMISAVICGYAEVFLGWEDGLGSPWLAVVFISFFAGLAYFLHLLASLALGQGQAPPGKPPSMIRTRRRPGRPAVRPAALRAEGRLHSRSVPASRGHRLAR